MRATFKALCDQQHFDKLDNLDALRAWCHANVSSDVQYSGEPSKQHAQYLELAKTYLDGFLAQIPPHHESLLYDHQMNAIQYAAYQGYDHYLSNQTEITDLNQATASGMTPLHLAAVSGHVHTVMTLINRGADTTRVNRQQQPPLFSTLFVPMLHNEDLIPHKELIFNMLYQAAPQLLTHQDLSGDTVFHLMAIHGFEALMTNSLKQAPEGVFIHNNYKQYPIHAAILNGQSHIVTCLLRDPKQAGLADAKERVPLHYAAQSGVIEIIQACCKATPNINIQDENHQTPLMLAVLSDNQPAIEILIQQGADTP